MSTGPAIGIYLDTDVYVIRPLDVFLKYEMTLDFEIYRDPPAVSNMIQITYRNARFLRHWIDGYRQYKPNVWFYNGGELPNMFISKTPQIIHRLKGEFCPESHQICHKLFTTYDESWRTDYYALHTFLRNNHFYHIWCVDNIDIQIYTFDEIIVSKMSTTFADMCRFVNFP
ncbi:unnamed protein product [Oppiella nova]|uniref:Uncharacterized protein n=1 Tax=Oppiella nova TaxID=334625 RepID=A0A7R9QHC0_9ACAR|nr:unnamed protein product [Oppiella nova]CAG2165778.1 unnamed protein product [Oppiella nova]